MSDPTQGDGVRVSGLPYAARVNYHQLISHVLIDMLYCDGTETFVVLWKITLSEARSRCRMETVRSEGYTSEALAGRSRRHW